MLTTSIRFTEWSERANSSRQILPNLTFNCELTKLQDENNALKQRLHDVEDPYYSLQWRGRQGGQSLPLPVPRSPASRTFVPLCLPTPALHCVAPVFRLIKRIRNPGFNFQTVPWLNILVHFLVFVLAEGSLVPDESYYRSVFLIKLSFTNRFITVWPSLLTSRYRDESFSSLCKVIAITISKSNFKKKKRQT